MFLLLEILIVGVLISYVCFSGHSRAWLGSLKPADSNLIFAILFLVVAAHFADRDGRFFPLISWRMYTHVYEPENVQWAELHAVYADGEEETINVAQMYPSIARNFQTRLQQYFIVREKGKLNEQQAATFDRLLNVFASKLIESRPKQTLTWIEAVLCSVQTDRPNVVERRVIHRQRFGEQVLADHEQANSNSVQLAEAN